MSHDARPVSAESNAMPEAALRESDENGPENESAFVRFGPLLLAAGAAVLVFFLLPPLNKSGLWDPFELNVADLSRRIALNLYHAPSLALEGADNSLPHLNDLGRPQLAFSSIGLGFKLFGLHEWAGRLPLAVWGLAGVLATYAVVARLFDRRAGVYAAIILTTTPLYFVQAKTMLGDVCAMAGLAMAFGGLAVAVFDASPPRPRRNGDGNENESENAALVGWQGPLPWLALAVVGLFVGFESRGGILGLGVPLCGVGLAWCAARAGSSVRTLARVGDLVGALALVAGVIVVAVGVAAASGVGRDLNLWVGATVHVPAKYPTFDFYVGSIGHSLAPWSAFLPFSLGRMLRAPSAGRPGAASERERDSLGRTAVLVALAVAFAAHAYLADKTDLIPFTAPALCAMACAIAIRDFELRASPSMAVAIGTLVLAGVLHHDFHELPEKAYQAFGVTGAQFPEGFKNQALSIWWIVLGTFAVSAFFSWAELDPKREPFQPQSYAKLVRDLKERNGGALAFLYFAAVAGTLVAAVVLFVGVKMRAPWLPEMSSLVRDILLNAWWVIAFVPLGALLGVLFVCDIWLWTFGRSAPPSVGRLLRGFEPFEDLFSRLRHLPALIRERTDDAWVVPLVLGPFFLLGLPAITFAAMSSLGTKPLLAVAWAVPSALVVFLVLGIVGDVLRHRAAGFVVAGGLAGALLCFSYYPALANQISPKDVYESYRRVCPDASLALLGVGGRTSAYYAGGQTQSFSDPGSAYRWLVEGPQRRCLALKAEELPKLNQLWRQSGGVPRTNLPIVDARSSQILLAASSIVSGERNDNPLSPMVLNAMPRLERSLHANLDDKIEVLGIDLLDDRGRAVEAVSPGRTYQLRTYYRVLAALTTEWEEFIHIDGYHRRHNGDHKPLNGKYPMSLWLPGDVLLDDYEFKLEPNFTPGTYNIYLGLFVGDTRLKVVSGPNDGDNRVNGGELRVQ
jgi:4-amino-4-deoxy-L-arabinose transferase-like glycosyltransferase